MTSDKDIRTITVVGAGIMGRGIAHVAAAGGFQTVLNDVSDELLQKAYTRIQSDLHKGVELGKLTTTEVQAALGRVNLERELGRATGDADLVIEAVPEKIDLKLDLFARLERTC